jgi:hypothetical protein
MGWSVGFDSKWNRDVGYGVPAVCDHPDCNEKIDRGLSYVCGSAPLGGGLGCGLYFCSKHRSPLAKRFKSPDVCERCKTRGVPFEPKPDVTEWVQHKLNDPSWKEWREKNPDEVTKMILAICRSAVYDSMKTPTDSEKEKNHETENYQ